MLAYLGLRSTAPEMLYFVAGLAFTASCAFGMATDAIMRGIGFGVIGNAIIGTAGAVIGAHLWIERTSYGRPKLRACAPASMRRHGGHAPFAPRRLAQEGGRPRLKGASERRATALHHDRRFSRAVVREGMA